MRLDYFDRAWIALIRINVAKRRQHAGDYLRLCFDFAVATVALTNT